MSLLTEKGLEKFKDHGEVPEDRFGNVFTSFTLLNQFGCSAERSLLEIFSSHGTHGADQDAPSHGLSEVCKLQRWYSPKGGRMQ